MRDTRMGVFLVVIVAAFWLVRFAIPSEPLLNGTSDLRNYFYPLYELFYGWLSEGRLSLWNPYHLAGYPQLATLQGGFWYPPHLAYVVLPTHIALALSNVAHLALIAVTTALLLRTIGVGVLAASVAALVFTLRGAVQWWLLWPAMLETGAWLPLGCIGVIGIARGRGLAPACWLAGATGMCLLAGHVQVAGYLLWTWTTLFAISIAASGRRLQAAFQFGAALVVGALLSGVQTLPGFELTLSGTRDVAGISPSQVLAMGTGGFRSFADALFSSQFSFGIVASALAPAALFDRRFRTVAGWALGLGAITLAIASISTEAGVDWYRSIPAIGWFRSPRRILFLTHFCVAVLAGLGVEAIGAALLGARVAGARFVLAGIVALVCIDAALANSISGRLPYRRADAAEYGANAALFGHLAEQAGEGRVVALPLPRSRDLKLAGRYGLRRIDDFEPLNLRRQAEYFNYFTLGRSADPQAKRFFAGDVIPERRIPKRQLVAEMRDMASRRRLLDLAGTRLFVTPKGLAPLQLAAVEAFTRAAGLTDRTSFEGSAIARNPHALDRAFVVYRSLAAPGVDSLLEQLAQPDFDPLAASYVEGDFQLGAGGPARGAPAAITLDEPTTVEIDATLLADGMLVLADAYYPGWVAEVDAVPTPIYPTNHLFRGVPVPAGRHRIRFEYRPTSVWIGAASSLTGALLLVGAARRSRRHASAG